MNPLTLDELDLLEDLLAGLVQDPRLVPADAESARMTASAVADLYASASEGGVA